jgi:hypothetical protein
MRRYCAIVAADAYALPRVRDAQPVRAEDVDARLLTHRANLTRIVHGDLLRDDEDLAQIRIHADQLGHAVARGRRRQIDHSAVEPMPGLQPFSHVVEDRNIACGRRKHLSAFAGRRTEYDIRARESVAHRRHVR